MLNQPAAPALKRKEAVLSTVWVPALARRTNKALSRLPRLGQKLPHTHLSSLIHTELLPKPWIGQCFFGVNFVM
jgi:hypothetical protein